jgi:hypothetical protein
MIRAAILPDSLGAFLASGTSVFIGDFLFDPALLFPWLSVVLRSWRSFSWFGGAEPGREFRAAGFGVTVGAVIMVAGYALGRAFLYSAERD